MSHEISETMVDGRKIAEAMYANRPAWHGLGQVFQADGQQAPDSETAIRLAHLDWQVDKESIQLQADGQPVDNYWALVRQDTRAPLSVVGNDYSVLQNRDAFAFLDSLQADGIIRYEACFALKGGRGIVLLARMPSVDFVTRDDAILRYILFSAWHGGGAIVATPTGVRAQCANMTRLAIRDAHDRGTLLSIRHSGDLTSKLSTMRHYLAQFDRAFSDYRENAQRLVKGYTPEQAAAYIDALFPKPVDGSGARSVNNRERRVDAVRLAFRSAAQNLPSVRGTWWALFNAVTETVDHATPARQSRDLVARAENRFISVSTGEGAAFKDQALALALSMAA